MKSTLKLQRRYIYDGMSTMTDIYAEQKVNTDTVIFRKITSVKTETLILIYDVLGESR